MNDYECWVNKFRFYFMGNRGWIKDFMKNIDMINFVRCLKNVFG